MPGPDNSGKVFNGTSLWISRGKPIAAIVILIIPVAVSVGMQIQNVKHLEVEILELKTKVNRLEERSVDKSLIEQQVQEARTFATVAENKCTLLRAQLIANGILKP